MAWCASSQLNSFGECRWRFYFGVLPRCALCPLFDAKRANLDALGENTPQGMVFEIRLGPHLRMLAGEHEPAGLDPGWHAPDHPPEHWRQQTDQQPPG